MTSQSIFFLRASLTMLSAGSPLFLVGVDCPNAVAIYSLYEVLEPLTEIVPFSTRNLRNALSSMAPGPPSHLHWQHSKPESRAAHHSYPSAPQNWIAAISMG